MGNLSAVTSEAQNSLVPGAVEEECSGGSTLSPEWCCLEAARLAQDPDAESQEGGGLPKAHDASLQERVTVSHCTKTEHGREPTDLFSSTPSATIAL